MKGKQDLSCVGDWYEELKIILVKNFGGYQGAWRYFDFSYKGYITFADFSCQIYELVGNKWNKD